MKIPDPGGMADTYWTQRPRKTTLEMSQEWLHSDHIATLPPQAGTVPPREGPPEPTVSPVEKRESKVGIQFPEHYMTLLGKPG